MQEYINLEQSLHLICQILAKLNRSLIMEEEDDSHTNLQLDLLKRRILGQPFEQLGRPMQFGLDLINLELGLYHGARSSLFTIPVEGKSVNHLENELAKRLKEYSVASAEWQSPMHYQIPNYPNQKKALTFESELMDKWINVRSLASEVSLYLTSSLNTNNSMRIWPHHFDSGLYIELPHQQGLGFGLGVADELFPQPYFYATHSDFQGNKNFNLTPSAPWHFHKSSSWEGMVYPIDKQFFTSYHLQKSRLLQFIKETIIWYGL